MMSPGEEGVVGGKPLKGTYPPDEDTLRRYHETLFSR